MKCNIHLCVISFSEHASKYHLFGKIKNAMWVKFVQCWHTVRGIREQHMVYTVHIVDDLLPALVVSDVFIAQLFYNVVIAAAASHCKIAFTCFSSTTLQMTFTDNMSV